MQERIAVMGLGYVGLPVALAFAEKFPGAVGFDVNKEKVDELRRGYDRNQEVPEAELKASSAQDHQRPRGPEGDHLLRGRGPHARRPEQRSRSRRRS